MFKAQFRDCLRKKNNNIIDIIKNDDLKSFKKLIESDLDINLIIDDDGMSLLHYAVYDNSINIINYLLSFSKININLVSKTGLTILDIAKFRKITGLF